MRNLVITLVTAFLFAAPSVFAAPMPERLNLPTSILLEARTAMRRGAAYLAESQRPDGSWANHPVITSLATVALLNAPHADIADKPSNMARALDYIKEQRKDDGGIWNARSREYPLYSTAMSMLALVRAGREADRPVLEAARAYLKNSQRTDVAPDSPAFGGFSENPGQPPTLTITQWVLEALYLTDSLEEEPGQSTPVYEHALVFIRRCQTAAEDGTYPADDLPPPGCFRDFPGGVVQREAGRAPGTPRSTAFLTCVGMKSLIYARCPPQHASVQSALRCLQSAYSTRENPELGQQGFYTYIFALSKALNSLGKDVLIDNEGKRQFWRRDVVLALLGRQHGDGSWRHNEPAWWENHSELVTAYALLTMQRCLLPEEDRL